jgi:folate-binding protein YgfZ
MTPESYRELLQRGGAVDLTGRAIVRFTGTDRTRYLNGQVTANVQSLPAGRGLPACVTTAKGKLCAEGIVTNGGDALWFDADPSLREALAPRFERYIIADDVTLEDLSDQVRLVHLLPGIEVSLDPLRKPPPDLLKSEASRLGQVGLDVFVPAAEFEGIWPKLREGRIVLTDEDVENLRIERGISRWGVDLDENTLPPEAGLDRTHIDYYKGCYIGQEVISRLKSIGHVNRRLVGLVSASGASLTRDAQIVPASDPLGDACGVLTSVGWSFALEKPVALGYLRRSAPPGDFVARPVASGAEPVPVTVSELPFTK